MKKPSFIAPNGNVRENPAGNPHEIPHQNPPRFTRDNAPDSARESKHTESTLIAPSRRQFFKFLGIAGFSAGVAHANMTTNPADSTRDSMDSAADSTNATRDSTRPSTLGAIASLIDIGKCDGCAAYDTPLCVSACKEKNAAHFPEPIAEIPPYFPRKNYEDYSKKRDDISRLTPYNWTYVEKLNVATNAGEREIFVPRRCHHCDNPTCLSLCPFGVISKEKSGAVAIDTEFCFGGAKCRDVCPWGIPQRQAGVGIYLKIAPKLAGGGAMFKCDMCADLLEIGKSPACEVACPKGAIVFGAREEIRAQAQNLAKKYEQSAGIAGTYIYGDKQNGGTATLYVAPLPFEMLSSALNSKHNRSEGAQKPGIAHLDLEVKNFVNNDSAILKSVLLAPFVGAIAGGIAVAKGRKKEKDSAKNARNAVESHADSTPQCACACNSATNAKPHAQSATSACKCHDSAISSAESHAKSTQTHACKCADSTHRTEIAPLDSTNISTKDSAPSRASNHAHDSARPAKTHTKDSK